MKERLYWVFPIFYVLWFAGMVALGVTQLFYYGAVLAWLLPVLSFCQFSLEPSKQRSLGAIGYAAGIAILWLGSVAIALIHCIVFVVLYFVFR